MKFLLFDPHYLTIKGVANYLRINQVSVYKLIIDGIIPTRRIGCIIRFKKEVIDEWLINLKVIPKDRYGDSLPLVSIK